MDEAVSESAVAFSGAASPLRNDTAAQSVRALLQFTKAHAISTLLEALC